MATPPDSTGISFSSPAAYSSGPSDEVDVLFTQAQRVTQLDPQVEALVTFAHNDFFLTFARRVNLIRSRSQAFEDCHITVFDKVLLNLTQNGDDLRNPAAITYFCEEFLAIPADVAAAQKGTILSNALAASVTAFVATAPAPTPSDTISGTSTATKQSDHDLPKRVVSPSDPESEYLAALAQKFNPSLSRLWNIYTQAKKDFQASGNPDGTKEQSAAKFLRDTAENTLQYLDGIEGVDARLVRELRATLNLAEDAVTSFHAGRKRKFDRIELGGPEDVGMPTQTISTDRGRALARKDIGRRRHSPRVFEQPCRGKFAGHTRALDQYQISVDFEEDLCTRRNAARELFPPTTESRRKKKKSKSKGKESRTQPGRGHSEIPFGYSRPVDSYQPSI